MSLTLECYCPGDPNIAICSLASLTLVMDVACGTSYCLLRVCRDGGAHCIDLLSGHSEQSLTAADWIGESGWNGVTSFWAVDRSLYLPDLVESSSATYHIEAVFQCLRNGEVVAQHTEYFDDGQGPVESLCGLSCLGRSERSVCAIGRGGAGGTILCSTPLGACNGCDVEVAWVSRPPSLDVKIDPDLSGALCLCPSGGTEPYVFTVGAGRLPTGQTLNPETGCVEGVAEAGSDPGASPITFQVADSTGATADVTCDIYRGCPGFPESERIGNVFY